jgi:hypothetical protein
MKNDPLILTRDQKVGDSSSPGRATEIPAYAGVSSSGWSLGQVAGRLQEPFFLCRAFAAIGDPHYSIVQDRLVQLGAEIDDLAGAETEIA